MGINEKDFLSYQGLHESYNKRILLVLVSLSKLVWGLAKIRIWKLSNILPVNIVVGRRKGA